MRLARTTLDDVTLGNVTWQDAIASGRIRIQGAPGKLLELLGLFEGFNRMLNVVTP